MTFCNFSDIMVYHLYIKD